jgi:hypothetical protein
MAASERERNRTCAVQMIRQTEPSAKHSWSMCKVASYNLRWTDQQAQNIDRAMKLRGCGRPIISMTLSPGVKAEMAVEAVVSYHSATWSEIAGLYGTKGKTVGLAIQFAEDVSMNWSNWREGPSRELVRTSGQIAAETAVVSLSMRLLVTKAGGAAAGGAARGAVGGPVGVALGVGTAVVITGAEIGIDYYVMQREGKHQIASANRTCDSLASGLIDVLRHRMTAAREIRHCRWACEHAHRAKILDEWARERGQ